MRIFRSLPGLILMLALGLVLGLALPHAGAQNFVAVPPLSAHVTDAIGMLDAKQKQSLENVLTDYEARTGSQVAVLLIASTAPEAIEQYSIRVAETWKVGRKGVDDGAILVVARDNPKALRRLRIEAGRGVQGTLTDAQSKRILQDVIAPHFRQNDYYGGLVAGVSAITSLLDQEHFPAPAKGAQPASEDDSLFGAAWPFLFFAIIILMSVFRSRGGRRSLSSNGWGRSSGIILGTGLGSGGFGGFGGFGGGSGSSGGGFSGGGGTFDGGGASGDW